MIKADNIKRMFGESPEPPSKRLVRSVVASWENVCLLAFENIYGQLFSYIVKEVPAIFGNFGVPLQNFVRYSLVI
jgi:hypothetical protein